MKEKKRLEVLEAMQQNALALVQDGENVLRYKTEEADAIYAVWGLEELTRQVLKSKGVLFKLLKAPNGLWEVGATKLGKRVFRFSPDIRLIQQLYPLHELNPYVALLIRVLLAKQIPERLNALGSNYGVFRGGEEVVTLVAELNAAIKEIRHEGKSKGFLKILGNFIRASNDNSRALRRYINALFLSWSRLLVLRIDLGYLKPDGWLHGRYVPGSLSQTKAHLSSLIRALRERLLDRGVLVGYAGGIEYGLQKGIHVHLMLFLDGSKVREDVTICRHIGELWKHEATEGQGIYYNCNADKGRYLQCGIGMVHYADSAMREVLENQVALYLTKPDYYITMAAAPEGVRLKQARTTRKPRTFFKGIMPKPKLRSKGGAPRRV